MTDALRPMRTEPLSTGQVLVRGLLAGVIGVTVMTVAEKIEQRITQRPNSYVPAETLQRMLGIENTSADQRLWLNWAMHWGQGILMGPMRALMAREGISGPISSFLFLNLRLLNDQTLENAMRTGAPPWTWPKDEQTIDLLHKAIYAYVTGAVVDSLIDDRRPRRKDGKFYPSGPMEAAQAQRDTVGPA